MSFTDEKSFTVTPHHCEITWGGGFMCGLCGHKFVAGDVARWVVTNDRNDCPGNPLVCQKCDGPDVIDRWAAMWAEFREIKKRFAWFIRNGEWK
ncbi:MAG: hypothetical protein KGL35_19105 [Bradyrhizobium sp.]|nr:hypothetical protein [Bradyrhizobium sp.]